MRVRDVMTHSPVSCASTTRVRLVAQLLTDHDCAAIPVTDSGRLTGIVTERDVTRAVASSDRAAELTAGAIMAIPVIALHADEPVENAAELMEANAIRHLPVIGDDGSLVGIVALSDLGLRMTNREFGHLARHTSARTKACYTRTAALVRKER